MPIIIRAPSALFSRTKRLCTLPLTPRVFHLNDHKRIRLIYMKNCTKREATSAICDTEIEINHVSSIFARRHCRRNHLKYTRKWREEKNNIYPLTHVSDCVCVWWPLNVTVGAPPIVSTQHDTILRGIDIHIRLGSLSLSLWHGHSDPHGWHCMLAVIQYPTRSTIAGSCSDGSLRLAVYTRMPLSQ